MTPGILLLMLQSWQAMLFRKCNAFTQSYLKLWSFNMTFKFSFLAMSKIPREDLNHVLWTYKTVGWKSFILFLKIELLVLLLLVKKNRLNIKNCLCKVLMVKITLQVGEKRVVYLLAKTRGRILLIGSGKKYNYC